MVSKDEDTDSRTLKFLPSIYTGQARRDSAENRRQAEADVSGFV